ncbi:MAG: phosphoglycerate mutase (2,3-diphosphoglycerate-independent) [Deltaproteobacteria bacterium RIFOXYA12_FULL_58_15]|nr:MAG: phosphoglycerate mutase (2,3-diphosphoglycerate-independent) [Deltaproteobacteria bacterium RIFOXYA12_FULL_58_15]OGR10804.1 MAG: phosphoglycerate mutase (2,3-diphosphoglycerate-independent) [Deltaproteobacteria bacterium RIFOXYB12_FULL_58_9]
MTSPKLTEMPGGVTGPVLAIIMDGVGIGRGDEADAVAAARTPNLDRLAGNALSSRLAAHGPAVGMPSDGDMGNSEVGHNALGAGRIFDQGAKLVANAIDSGRLFEGKVWAEIIARCNANSTPLHLLGLLSDGNVHSHIDHVIAMVRRADQEGVKELYVHPLLDGRDVPKVSAHLYVEQLEGVLGTIDKKVDRRYRVASGGGRMTTTMDRYESDWRIVERGWRAHVLGEARPFASAMQALETFRAEDSKIVDQELPSFTLVEDGKPVGAIKDGACVVAFNFRGDRMLEMVRAFEDDHFDKFNRVRRPEVFFAGMMEYDGDTHRPKNYLVEPPEITSTLSELLCERGIAQLACAETQKYGHVTYFWNGNKTGKFSERLETYIEVPSYAPPFDERPEMRAPEIADTVQKALESNIYRFLRINFANGDMVGHTGNFDATVKAVEAVDQAIGRLVEPVLSRRGALIVTADHGNADDMGEWDKKKNALKRDAAGLIVPKTAHSLNPVVFHLVMSAVDRGRYRLADVKDPGLGNVAATITTLLGYAPPEFYMPSLIATR